MKYFNTEGACILARHYMVSLDERLKQIKMLVDAGKYFTINRARQYGKTTTLKALAKYLEDEYVVVPMDFQDIGNGVFESEAAFTKALARLFMDAKEFKGVAIPGQYIEQFEAINGRSAKEVSMDEIFRIAKRWCKNSEKKIVLMIDEVDSAANNQVFLDFLAQLRSLYLYRDETPTFQSVILAGVTDVKYLRNKFRNGEPHKVNSPWNIAVDFQVDMSLSQEGIEGMLKEYEADHHTGMNTGVIARMIHEYTDGYPYLVSRICQRMDQNLVPNKFQTLAEAWTAYGVEEAIKIILGENNTLFQSLAGKLTNYPEMRQALRSILMEGQRYTYVSQNEEIAQLEMYGFIRNQNGVISVSNRIFETVLYNLFLSGEELKSNVFSRQGALEKNIFVEDGMLNMRLVLEHFIKTYTQVFGPLVNTFKEKDGRELFLLYLKPIINGTGNYYIEAQTRDQKRTDVIVDYLGKQYIVELKIWYGERYNQKGEQQIREYLDYFGLTTGYMLSFNFNKNKKSGMKRVHIEDKILFEGTI